MRWLFTLMALTVTFSASSQSKTDSLIHAFQASKNDSLKIEAAIRLYDPMATKYPDSLYNILTQAAQLADDANDQEQKIILWTLTGQLFERLANYVEAQKLFLKSVDLLDSIRNELPDSTYLKQKISLANNLAIVYFRTGKLEEARKYYLEMIKSLENTSSKDLPANSNKLYATAYHNMGSTFLQENKYDEAESYFLKAIPYLNENENKSLSSVLNNLGIIEKDRGNFEKAYDYLGRAITMRRKEGSIDGEVQSLNNLGSLLWKMGATKRALDTLLKAGRMAEENKLLESYAIALEDLAGIYSDLREYKKAYQMHVRYLQVHDSLMDQANLRNITQIEMQQRFNKILQEEKMQRQQENLSRQRKETIYLFVTITAVFMLLLLILLYALQRSKMKRQQLIAEKDKAVRKTLELENEKLNMDLDYKNKELTTNVMYLARTNEFITEIGEKLMKRRIYFAKENQQLIDELIRDLQSFSDRDTWKEFELRFQEVHSEFYSKLLEQFPDLSSNEKKLCAFLRLNMTTKEISAITYQSVNSITVARSRLRKKLGIDKDENLIAFLEKL